MIYPFLLLPWLCVSLCVVYRRIPIRTKRQKLYTTTLQYFLQALVAGLLVSQIFGAVLWLLVLTEFPRREDLVRSIIALLVTCVYFSFQLYFVLVTSIVLLLSL